MSQSKNWKEFINCILINSGQFSRPTAELKGETETETYKLIDKDTEIRVGYLNNRLIFLRIFNPILKGYNKYREKFYYNENDFNSKSDCGNPALEYNDLNKEHIIAILKNGLNGYEIQYIKDNKILKSTIFVAELDFKVKESYDFTGRPFLKRIFRKSISQINGVVKRKIDLKEIFDGVKTYGNKV